MRICTGLKAVSDWKDLERLVTRLSGRRFVVTIRERSHGMRATKKLWVR